MLSNKRAKRKASGGRYKPVVKRISNASSNPTHTKLSENKVKESRTRGASLKRKLLSANKVNVYDGKKSSVVEISNVVENPANRHLVRRNVLTKGAVVEITSRPGQEGAINGVLVK